jgi:hypothetical protein
VAVSVAAILLLLAVIPAAGRAQKLAVTAPEALDRTSWADQPKYRSDVILVRFRPDVSLQRSDMVHGSVKAERVKTWSSAEGWQLVRLPPGGNLKNHGMPQTVSRSYSKCDVWQYRVIVASGTIGTCAK